MKTLVIKKQLLVLEDERFSNLLDILGVKYVEFAGTPEQIRENQNLRLIDLRIEGRWGAFRHIPNYREITLAEFCERYSRKDVLRMRNVGPKTIASLSKELARYGFAW
jgi:hypothetical protein